MYQPLLSVLLLILPALTWAQPTVKVYMEREGEKFVLYADSPEYCPITLELNLTLKNMQASGGPEQTLVLPARANRHKLTTLTIQQPGRAYSYASRYLTNYGNHLRTDYDSTYVYHLPFNSGQSYRLYQGYHGSFSHQKEYALDFTMPEGTPVLAVRQGVVVKVVDKNKKNCDTRDCAQYNNYILIYHTDGTFAEYAHIQKNGARVQPGDTVEQDQLIALSGNVGWSTGPHLHFVVFQQLMNKRRSLPGYFRLSADQQPAYLVENQVYLRQY